MNQVIQIQMTEERIKYETHQNEAITHVKMVFKHSLAGILDQIASDIQTFR